MGEEQRKVDNLGLWKRKRAKFDSFLKRERNAESLLREIGPKAFHCAFSFFLIHFVSKLVHECYHYGLG